MFSAQLSSHVFAHSRLLPLAEFSRCALDRDLLVEAERDLLDVHPLLPKPMAAEDFALPLLPLSMLV